MPRKKAAPNKKSPARRKTPRSNSVQEKRIQEKQAEDFAKGMEDFGRNMERAFGKKRRGMFCFTTFGPLGPVLSSIVSIVFLAIGVYVLAWLNSSFLSSVFLESVVSFVSSNLHWFFVFTLFAKYIEFSSLVLGIAKLKPISVAAGITVALWAITGILQTYVAASGSHVPFVAGIQSMLWPVFAALLVLCFAVSAALSEARKKGKNRIV